MNLAILSRLEEHEMNLEKAVSNYVTSNVECCKVLNTMSISILIGISKSKVIHHMTIGLKSKKNLLYVLNNMATMS